jgi:hypothetical protein
MENPMRTKNDGAWVNTQTLSKPASDARCVSSVTMRCPRPALRAPRLTTSERTSATVRLSGASSPHATT